MASLADKIKQIQAMGFDVDVQLLEMVINDNKGDVDKALDELLTMNAQEIINGSYRPADLLRGSIRPSAAPVGDNPANKPESSKKVADQAEQQELKALALEKLAQNLAAQPAPPPAVEQPFTESQVVPVIENPLDTGLDDKLNMEVLLGIDNTWPQFTIYSRSDVTTTTQIKEISNMNRVLLSLAAQERRQTDISYDYELQGLVKAKCEANKIPFAFPVVFFRDLPIGNLEKLTKLRDSGKLKDMIEQDNKQHADLLAKASDPSSPSPAELVAAAAAAAGMQPQIPVKPPSATTSPNASLGVRSEMDLQLNFFDRALNTVESVASWFNPWSWFKSGAKSATSGKVDYREFDVVQSNWYWRHQHRKLRFADDFFVRLHPTLQEVRALHKIDDVAKITLLNAMNFILHYKDQGSPDFIRASEADVLAMCDLIASHPKRDPNFVIEKLSK